MPKRVTASNMSGKRVTASMRMAVGSVVESPVGDDAATGEVDLEHVCGNEGNQAPDGSPAGLSLGLEPKYRVRAELVDRHHHAERLARRIAHRAADQVDPVDLAVLRARERRTTDQHFAALQGLRAVAIVESGALGNDLVAV